MTDILLRMLCGATLGLAGVLLLRRPARRVFGAGPAFTLWLLPVMLAFAPLLPHGWTPGAMVVLPGLTVTPHAAASTPVQPGAFGWGNLLMTPWWAGVACGLARLVWHYARLRRGMRAAPAAWSHWLASAAPGFDLRRVRVHAAGPALLWALPRALVLLPSDFAGRFDDPATRELVLRHELTHAHRGDAWWTLAMEVASSLLWFHPLAWIARARFRLDQELACDAASLRALPERSSSYARALLDSAAVQPVPALIPWLTQPQLKERLAMIARVPPGALRRRAGFLAVAALVGTGVWFVGAQTPVQAAAQTPSASPPPMALLLPIDTAPSIDVVFKQRNPPKYPVEALRKGEQGEVMLDISVDAAGNVTGVRVDPARTTASALLQSVSIAAAARWKFNPGRKDGKPVGGVVQVPVNFSLRGADSTQPPAPASS